MTSTVVYFAAPGVDPTGSPDSDREAEIRRLEREWTEASTALTNWAIASDRDPDAWLDQETGYRLAWRALGTEQRYLRAVGHRATAAAVGTAREARLRREYDEARGRVRCVIAIGAGLGHVILAGCGLWRPQALVPPSDPLELRVRDAALLHLRITADAWRNHVEFTRASRRGRTACRESDGPATLAIRAAGRDEPRPTHATDSHTGRR